MMASFSSLNLLRLLIAAAMKVFPAPAVSTPFSGRKSGIVYVSPSFVCAMAPVSPQGQMTVALQYRKWHRWNYSVLALFHTGFFSCNSLHSTKEFHTARTDIQVISSWPVLSSPVRQPLPRFKCLVNNFNFRKDPALQNHIDICDKTERLIKQVSGSCLMVTYWKMWIGRK